MRNVKLDSFWYFFSMVPKARQSMKLNAVSIILVFFFLFLFSSTFFCDNYSCNFCLFCSRMLRHYLEKIFSGDLRYLDQKIAISIYIPYPWILDYCDRYNNYGLRALTKSLVAFMQRASSRYSKETECLDHSDKYFLLIQADPDNLKVHLS